MSLPRNISIARVIARLNVGGPAIQAILMTNEFRRRGYGSTLLTGDVARGEASMEYLAASKGVDVIKLNSMSRRISVGRDLVSLWRLWRVFSRDKPTIVHTHTAKAGALGRIAAVMAGVPIRVHTFHGHVFSGYFPRPVARLFIAIERQLARHTDSIIAVSNSQRRELSESFEIAPAERIEVVPLGFELEPFLSVNSPLGTFKNSLRGNPSGVSLVGWVGRFAPIKAPDLFLDCAADCMSQGSSAYFVMVGDGELRERCQARLLPERLHNTLEIVGWRRDLPSVYSDLDLIVSTSINEGTPVALLEAMAAAKPFIATDVGGTRDLMVGLPSRLDGMEIFQNAILVPRDRVVLARAVRYLLDRPDLRVRMGGAGRAFVSRRFSEQRLADDLERLYLRLAKAKGILPVAPTSHWAFPVPDVPVSQEFEN